MTPIRELSVEAHAQKLPRRLKLITYLGLIMGLSNAVSPLRFVFPTSGHSFLSLPDIRACILWGSVLGGALVICSLALLGRREWGRKGTIGCLVGYVVYGGAYFWLVYLKRSWPEEGTIWQKLSDPSFLVQGLAVAVAVGICGLLVGLWIGYLRKERIRKLFD